MSKLTAFILIALLGGCVAGPNPYRVPSAGVTVRQHCVARAVSARDSVIECTPTVD